MDNSLILPSHGVYVYEGYIETFKYWQHGNPIKNFARLCFIISFVLGHLENLFNFK